MPNDWKYGDAGDRYPVAEGDIWRVGRHMLACGDLEKGAGTMLLRYVGEPPAMAYCDPPWTQSLLTGFRTKAGLGKGMYQLELFLDLLCSQMDTVTGDIYTEIGSQNLPNLMRSMRLAAIPVRETWDITYYKKKPAHLVRGGGPNEILEVDFGGMDDVDTPRLAILTSSSSGELVWDPCTGRGLTATTAHRLDRRFVGLELNPRRLAVAIDLLSRMGAGIPIKVGSIYG